MEHWDMNSNAKKILACGIMYRVNIVVARSLHCHIIGDNESSGFAFVGLDRRFFASRIIIYLFQLLFQVALATALHLGFVPVLAEVFRYIVLVCLVISPNAQLHTALGDKGQKNNYGNRFHRIKLEQTWNMAKNEIASSVVWTTIRSKTFASLNRRAAFFLRMLRNSKNENYFSNAPRFPVYSSSISTVVSLFKY